ncbi:MAG: hypothetical protein KJ709_04605 [Nanoarchaeota archaeon]|nr:hypothetical protein [Nanoarchaeota archaeon]
MREPESMEELIYFTRRSIGKGHARVWVFKQECPECHKALMGKPKGKAGSVKMRAKEYTCPECGFTVEKKEHEESLMANCEYTCPECGHQAKVEVPFIRKKVKGTETLKIKCDGCGCDIDITKKMKAKKG